ncbi:MAG: hypothetical protein RLZZ11_1982 [Cyanobacteriota bacterium]
MSKVDQVFGPIPGPLIAEWGQAATFVAVTGSGTDRPMPKVRSLSPAFSWER